MAKDINLLPDITLNEEKDAKKQKLLTYVSMAILIAGVVALLLAFTFDITLGTIQKGVEEENAKRIEAMSSYAEVEIMQRTVKSKLTTSATILKASKDYKTHLENLQSILPENGISIQSILIDKTDKITLAGKANDSVSFNLYINNLLSADKGVKFFDDVNLTTVSSAKDGTIQFGLTMNLKKAEAAK